MSISVKGVTKIYGKQKALDNVSLEVNSGEIVGFLGPNGAGKSTMMKIITCYIPPTEGQVTVSGFDIRRDSISVRNTVGYLPEHNPLYLDMFVKEYLLFVGGLYKLKKVKSRVEEMIEMVGLQLEQNKKISALSKGYRQRIGLAQALIHDPQVLILDEPTSGLDPNQLVEIRSLIRRIGKEKTVMLSTHIMQEVEAICDKIIIINRGKIVADNVVGSILNMQKEAVVTVEFSSEVSKSDLKKINGVLQVQSLGNFSYRLVCNKENEVNQELFKLAVAKDISVVELKKESQKLEDIFKELTR